MNIVDSIKQCGASDKLEVGAWRTLCTAAASVPDDELSIVLKNSEKEFKEETGRTELPARWRSAKSVYCAARRNNIATMLEDTPVAKSVVEKAIKDSKPKEESSPIQVVEKLLDKIADVMLQFDEGPAKDALKGYITARVNTIC